MNTETTGHAAIEGPVFNKILIVATIVGLVLTSFNFFMPTGQFLPPWLLLIQVLAMSLMLMMHLARSLGLKGMLVYLVVMMAWEFLSEQIDIITTGGWYGAHFAYTELWGPRFMGVPIVPPVSISILVWPAFCCASVLLYGNYHVDHSKKPWLETIVFAVICGVFISWMPVIYEAVCINMGAYTYPQIESGTVNGYWGVPLGTENMSMPLGVFPGFTVLVALQVITFTRWIGPRFLSNHAHKTRKLDSIMDLAPIGFFVLLGLGMSKVAMSVEAQLFGMYTGTFFAILALFAFYRNVKANHSGALPRITDPVMAEDEESIEFHLAYAAIVEQCFGPIAKYVFADEAAGLDMRFYYPN